MDKWVLLVLSALSVFFNIQFAQWIGLIRNYSEGETERLVGLNGKKELPPEERGSGSRFVIADAQRFVVILFICSLAISGRLIFDTFKAFSL